MDIPYHTNTSSHNRKPTHTTAKRQHYKNTHLHNIIHIQTQNQSQSQSQSQSQQAAAAAAEAFRRSWRRRCAFLSQAAFALHFLHSQPEAPLLHRDIKPGNLLVAETWDALVADFGLATKAVAGGGGGGGEQPDEQGTLVYMAPELFAEEAPSPASDVYSFAMVMWCMATKGGKGEPWAGNEHVAQQLVAAGHRPELSTEEIEAPDFVRLMRRCWDEDPDARPPFGEIAEQLKMMQYNFPASQAELTQTQSTTKMFMNRLPCRLTPQMVSQLKEEKKWRKDGLNSLHSVQVGSSLNQVQQELLDVARRQIQESCNSNRDFETRYPLVAVTAVHNPTKVSTFCGRTLQLGDRGKDGWEHSGPFMPTWHDKNFCRYGPHDPVTQTAEQVEWRQKVKQRFAQYPSLDLSQLDASSLGGASLAGARVHTVFHVCNDETTALQICKTGFAKLASLDAGFFSMGLYFSFELDYIVPQYGIGEGKVDADGCVTVLVCNVVVGNLYPVIENPHGPKEQSLKGKAQVPKYDAHAVVVAQDSCLPCPHSQWNAKTTFSELVLFEDAAILPRFVLTLRART